MSPPFRSADLVCQAPDCTRRGVHEHHVVAAQELRRLRLPENNPRNALKLCMDCHFAHEYPGVRSRKLPTSSLHEHHLDYAFHVLGARAYDYLRRHYDDSKNDPRLKFRLLAAEFLAA